MATATVARPAQALRDRQRRDAPRLSLSKRHTNMDSAGEPAVKKRKLSEPYVRDSKYILNKHKGKSPSLTIHLHPTHFRFDGQADSYAYDGPMRFIIQHLKRNTVPHEMMEELLRNNVTFYDGCLIVEVHNHRPKAGKEHRSDSRIKEDTVKFGMHNYNDHVTPSPMVAFPGKARQDGTPEKHEGNEDMPAPERPKEKDGPTIHTLVLHPTPLTQHNELLILAQTPTSEVRNKRKGNDGTSSSSGQPPTPQLSVPPTPISATSRATLSQSQKMCLEEGEIYSFQADMLVATEPPLFLDPCDNPQDAQKILDMLQNPLYQDEPPSPKTRKRTTAEMAADDAQKAETERRMLIMDERIKPTGAAGTSNETQAGSASLGFSRFKTIEMVRQTLEEKERVKKEEEARAALEKKQAEEQLAQQQRLMAAQRQREITLAQQQPNQQAMLMAHQHRERMRVQQQAQAQAQQQQAQQQALMNAQNHAHPQQNNMIQNQQQNLAGQTNMPHTSPVVRQQTPMMNSSPMVAQGGFPMVPTSSHGAGSPPRPTSAVPNPNMGMVRQASQQQISRNNTPQLPHGTPAMAQAMPNRQMSATPRMPPASPGVAMQHGTPQSATIPMQTPHMGNQLTPEQMAMLQQRSAMAQGQQNAAMHAGSPQNMTPEQIQNIQNMQRLQQQQQMANSAAQRNAIMAAQQAAQQGNNAQAQAYQMQMQRQQQQAMFLKQRQQQLASQQQMHGQAGSPNGMQQPTPQMTHAHPQQPGNQGQMTPQALAQAHSRAQHLAQLRNNQMQQQVQQILGPYLQQYGSIANIPPQEVANLPPPVQNFLRQQNARNQQAQQARIQAMRAQQAQQQAQGAGGTSEQVPGGQPNPQYMQALRNNQNLLAAQASMQMQNQQGGMNNLAAMSFTMGNNGNMGGQNFGGGQQGHGGQGGDNLTQQFAAMQNALNRSAQQGGGGQQGMQ